MKHPYLRKNSHLRPPAFSFGILLLYAFVTTTSYADNIPDLRYWITNGVVNAVFNEGATLYLGGNFTQAGPNTGHGAELNVANGSHDVNGPLFTGPTGSTVYVAKHDGDDGWFVGGDFTLVREDPRGSIPSTSTASKMLVRRNLAHIKKDKTLAAVFDPTTNGSVRAMAYSSSAKLLYIGGTFTNVDSEAHLRIAVINTTTGTPISTWSPSIGDGTVRALALSNDGGVLYVGGDFTTVNTTAGIRGIAALDTATGALISAWGGAAAAVGAGEQINAMVRVGNLLYVGGEFTTVGGKARNNIAALSIVDGVATDSWNPGADGTVNALSVGDVDTLIYAGGAFSTLDGTARARLGRLRVSDGGLDTTWAPSIDNGEVRTIEVPNQVAAPRVFVGGSFTSANGAVARGGVALNTGANTTNWSLNTDDPIETLAISTNSTRVFAGGSFRSTGMQTRNNIAAFTTAQGDITAWAPEVSGGDVLALTLSSDKKNLYLGGDFTTVTGTNQARLARLRTDNGALIPWRPNVESGAVTTLALADTGKNITRLVFSQDAVFACTPAGLFRSQDAGTTWTNVSGDLGNVGIADIALDPNTPLTLYVGTQGSGFFKSTDGGTRWSKINAGISNLNANAIVVASNSTTLYAATDAQSQTEAGFYRSDDSGTTWSALANGTVLSLAVHPKNPEIVYVGTSIGLFRSINSGVVFESGGTGISDPNILRVMIVAKPGTDEINGYALSGNAINYDYGLDGRWNPYTKLGVVANDFAVNPNDENLVYVSSLGNGVYALEATTTTSLIDPSNPESDTQKTANVTRWQQRNSGLSNTQVFSIALNPNVTDTLMAGTSLGYVYLSTDNAQSWSERHRGIPTDVLYIGGTFSGSHPDFLAALDTSIESTDYFLDWNPNSSDRVETLRLANNNTLLYAGGAFTVIGGQPRRRIAALDTSTAAATSWAPDVNNGTVNAIALNSTERTLYLGGSFTNVGNLTRNRLAALNTTDGALTEWDPAADNDVTGLAVANKDNLVFALGRFSTIGGQTRSRLASLLTTANTNNATSWSPNADVDFTRNSLVADDNTIYIGGSFTQIGDMIVRSFAGYTFTAPTLSITPIPQAYPDTQSVTLSCKESTGQSCSGNIYYTTDTDLKTATWQVYSVPVVIATSTNLSYYGETNEGIRSESTTAKYIIDPQRPTVSVDIPSGTYPFTQTVAVICNDGQANDASVSSCAEVFYTEDGSTPAFTSQPNKSTGILGFSTPAGSTTKRYISPVPVRIDLTLQFVAVDKAGNVSEQGVSRYRILRGEESAGYTGMETLAVLILIANHGMWRRRRLQSLKFGR